MRDDLLAYLCCPYCRMPLLRAANDQIGCHRGHRFDEAKQGYLALFGARRPRIAGDTAEMVASRDRFLRSGAYRPIADAVIDVVAPIGTAGLVLDVGCGPGWYLAQVLDHQVRRLGLGVDLSLYAARRAASVHPRCGAVVADVTGALPLVDASAAVVLDIFAPRHGSEYWRVLKPGGRLVVVTPQAQHLRELVADSGLVRVDPDKQRRLRDALTPWFTRVETHDLDWTMELSQVQAHDIVHMGPSHHHVSSQQIPSITTVTAAVTVTAYAAVDSVADRDPARS